MQIIFGIYYAVSNKLAKVLQKHFHHPMINEWKESFLFHMVLHVGIIWNASDYNIQQRTIHASVNKFSPRSCWHANSDHMPHWKMASFPFAIKKKMACRPNLKYCPCAGIKESDRKRIFTSKNKTNHKLQFLPLIYAASNEMKRETDWILPLHLISLKTK